MDYTEFYYSEVIGNYPFDTDYFKNKTNRIFDYLLDAKIESSDIIRFIQESKVKDFLGPEDLPDWLWDGSLIKRDTFYYHNTLHIKPEAPIFNPYSKEEKVETFYLEMEIKYTIDDLIKYFYKTLNINTDLSDNNKDKGSFNYLFNKYKKIDFVEPLDFVLALIDNAKTIKDDSGFIKNILDISNGDSEVYEMLKRKSAEATLVEANKILWRQ